MDHFTHNIIRNELRALTAFPPPDPTAWAFSSRNDCLFHDVHATNASMSMTSVVEAEGTLGGIPTAPITPLEWVRKGPGAIKDALARA